MILVMRKTEGIADSSAEHDIVVGSVLAAQGREPRGSSTPRGAGYMSERR